ncbi:MAG: hypothetical protein ABJH08_02105 [Balneola sp.]
MKFDLGSIIITAIALLAFIIPVSLDQRNKKKASKILKQLLSYAKTQKMNVDKSAVFQHAYALGLDTKQKSLIYLKKDISETIETTYDLNKISNCRLHQSELTEEGSDISKIGFLKLQFHAADTESIDLLIYKMKKNLAYTEEENKAKKLVKDIKTLL